MEFRTVFVVCLVLVPYAGGLDLPDSQDNVNQFANQASDDMQSNIADQLKEFTPDLNTEQQNRLATLLSNKDFLLESAKLAQQYAGNTDSDAYNQAQKELVTRYLNGGAVAVVSLVALVASLVVQGLMMFG